MKSRAEFLIDATQIYPIHLVLLSLLPTLAGYVIDFDLVSNREFLINLAWIPLFTIPYRVFQKAFLRQLIFFSYFLIGLIELSHWIIIKGPLSVTSILVISNSNLQEMIEFLDLKATVGLLLLIPYGAIYYLALQKDLKTSKRSSISAVVICVLAFAVIFIGENVVHGRLIRKGVPHFAKVAFSFHDKISLFQEAREQNEVRNIDAVLRHDYGSQTCVLIIGESCSRNHMSLYGYAKETSPKLAARDDLIVFEDVISAYSNTLNSVLTMLSVSNLENKIELTKGIDILDVFTKAGFKTFWLSNQSPIGIWDNLITVFANKADQTKFVNFSSNSSFESTYTASYDAKLFTPLNDALNDTAQKKLIVVHLIGSHSSYAKRYPSAFDIYQGGDAESSTIAAYDNSIRYNDYIVDSILQRIEFQSNQIEQGLYCAVYLSDHGENVYDENNSVGHDYANILPKSNVEIPFVVWLSEQYKRKFALKTEKIRCARNNAIVTDDLFHCLLDLNNIQSSVYIESQSAFSQSFNNDRKRVLEDHRDYDLTD